MDASNKYVRCALYPRHIPSGTQALAIEGYLLDLPKIDKKHYGLSIGSVAALGSRDAAHKFGCATAAAANKSKAERNAARGQPLKPDDRTSYLGYYVFDAALLTFDDITLYTIEIVQNDEAGIEEHCDLLLTQVDQEEPAPGINLKRATERTKILRGIMDILSGPDRHICQEDVDIEDLLKAIDLPLCGQPFSWC